MALEFKHGRNGYIANGCRCDVCRSAATAYSVAYRRKKVEKKLWLSDGFKHGISGYDLGCRCEVCRKDQADNKRERRNRDIETSRAKAREYLRLHAEEHRERVKKYNKEHPESQRVRSQRYCTSHKKERQAWSEEYYNKHAVEFKKYQKMYQNERYHFDVSYRIRRNLRSRVGSAIERGCKSARTLELLGCSVEELRNKLETKFSDGMSWDNYGDWSIDHIIPCSAFDLNSSIHQRACFNWRNLQPLWRRDNQVKNATMPSGISLLEYVDQFKEISSGI